MSQNRNEDETPRLEFSQELHEKIMGRIVRAQTSQRRSWHRRRFVTSGLAAMVALTFGLILSMKHVNPRTYKDPTLATARQVPSVPTIQNPIRALELPAVYQVAAADYSDVDRDGEKLLDYMTRELDVLPLRKSAGRPE